MTAIDLPVCFCGPPRARSYRDGVPVNCISESPPALQSIRPGAQQAVVGFQNPAPPSRFKSPVFLLNWVIFRTMDWLLA